jgi:hypothetical protein
MKFNTYLKEAKNPFIVKEKREKRKNQLVAMHFMINTIPVCIAHIGITSSGYVSWNYYGLSTAFGVPENILKPHFVNFDLKQYSGIYSDQIQDIVDKFVSSAPSVQIPEKLPKVKDNRIKVVKKATSVKEKFEFFAGDIKVASYTQRKDYVKAKETDRIRTKLAIVNYLSWDVTGLKKLFGMPVTTGTSSAWRPSQLDFYDRSGRGSRRTLDIVDLLNGFAKSKKLNLEFK